jgi:hypothetical protein
VQLSPTCVALGVLRGFSTQQLVKVAYDCEIVTPGKFLLANIPTPNDRSRSFTYFAWLVSVCNEWKLGDVDRVDFIARAEREMI